MSKTHIVALRNNGLTEDNIELAIQNQLWGMATKGKHKDIASGDNVCFLIGISIHNLQQVRTDARYDGVFPNFTNILIADSEFIDTFTFSIEKAYLGTVTSDFFTDDTPIWAPVVSKSGKVNNYRNRFNWELTHEAESLLLTPAQTNSDFHSDLILALRDKGAQPSELQETELQNLLQPFRSVNNDFTEEQFQNSIQISGAIDIPSGHIPKNGKTKSAKGKQTWSRKAKMSAKAIHNAKFTCELGPQHKTFVSDKTGKDFMEAHHFIPMEFQDKVEVSIDVPENILSLCPTCHRQFHHAIASEKEVIIGRVFSERESLLLTRGIDVSLTEVLKIYGCK
jgi:hypothetical protein